MVAEILILVPSIARFRLDYLSERLERSQIAAFAVLSAPSSMVEPELEEELLLNAGVRTIALRRDDFRELVLVTEMLESVQATFDLSEAGAFELIWDAIECAFHPGDRMIRVIGVPVHSGGDLIEATMSEGPLKAAMLEYGQNILLLSLFIAVVTAVLLNLAVRRFIVAPIKRVAGSIADFSDNPEDANRFIVPQSGILELREAEDALKDMQRGVSGSLRQKERLAQLGGAVAKISHDLRNMLTTAQLLADRMEVSEDKMVAKRAPKLMNSLNRAINLCEQTLKFGKTDEAAPDISRIDLSTVLEDVLEAESLRDAEDAKGWSLEIDAPERLTIDGDSEQLFRVVTNLARNARQAIAASGKPGSVTVATRKAGAAAILEVADTGPGLPERARENLFKPFQGGTRREGTGLGLVIAEELVRGHGGTLKLLKTGPQGTTFQVTLPNANPAVKATPTAVIAS